MTSDTNSCITLKDLPVDEDFNFDESEDSDDIEDLEDDPNSTMLIQTPQVSSKFDATVYNNY